MKRELFTTVVVAACGILLLVCAASQAEADTSLRHSLLSQNLLEDEEWEVKDLPERKDLLASGQSKKSTYKAVLLSLLVPGAGEFYADSKARGKIFLGTEASLWMGYFGFRTYGAWAKKDYKSYAAVHAGVNLNGKADEFFEDMNFYVSRDEYNQLARLYQREEAQVYPETDFWYWYWDSPQSQHYYRKLRNRSEAAYRKALFMVGLAGVNRVLSVIDAIREVRKYNRKLDEGFSALSLSFDLNPVGENSGFKIALNKSF